VSIPEESVSSLREYMDIIEKHAKPGYTLFRGQPDKDCHGEKCKLLPRIAREDPVVSLEDEMALTGELERRGLVHLEWLPAKEWEWMALAQHYGLPTRLLDWTRHALTALWFAVCEQRRGWETRLVDATVWVFRYATGDINWAEKVTPKERLYGEMDRDIRRTQVLLARHIDARMVAQSGCFTGHARDCSGGFIALDDEEGHKAFLTKISIRRDGSDYVDLRRQLDLLGVNESVLFPDLDGLCSHIIYSQRERLRKR
jgi:type I restriction enzyme M protein